MIFIQFEKKLQETDRQRDIYKYLSQFCNVEQNEYNLWRKWEDFEIEQGNEDTYREYLNFKA